MSNNGQYHSYLDCICSSMDHIARVDLDTWDPLEDPELSLTVKLNPNYSFWKRLVVAFKYLFNIKRSSCWDYDYVVLTKESIDRLSTMIIQWRLLQKLRIKRRAKKYVKEKYSEK